MAHSSAKPSQDGTYARPNTVLLVDDQPELRRIVGRLLTKAGYEVMEASNGRNAIELARRMDFDLAISDVHMPDLSGVELLAALHVHDPDLPVVLTSGSPEERGFVERGALPAFAYLEKPVSSHTLLETARRALEQRRSQRDTEHPFEPYASVQRLRLPRPHDDES